MVILQYHLIIARFVVILLTHSLLHFFSQDSCNFKDQLTTATKATVEEYAEVYSSKLDTVISTLLFGGTRHILNGDSRKAQLFAFLACYFEDFMAIGVHKTKATLRSTKLAELSSADDHTLVSYYRNTLAPAWTRNTKRSSL